MTSKRDEAAPEPYIVTVYAEPFLRPASYNVRYELREIETIYPAVFLDEICTQADFAPEQRIRLRDFLIRISSQYAIQREVEVFMARAVKARDALQLLKPTVGKLSLKIRELSEGDQVELRRAWNLLIAIPPILASGDAQSLWRKNGESYSAHDFDSAVSAIDSFAKFAAFAPSKLVPTKEGRQETSPAFQEWAREIITYWDGSSSTPFRNNWRRGEPLTKATLFLFELARRLAPDLSPKAIQTGTTKMFKRLREAEGEKI